MIDIKAAPAGGPGPDGDEFDMDVFYISANSHHKHDYIKEAQLLEPPGNIFNVRSVYNSYCQFLAFYNS